MANSKRQNGQGAAAAPQTIAEGERGLVAEAFDRFEKAGRETAHAVLRGAEDARELMALSGAVRGGLYDIQDAMAGLAEGFASANLRMTQELFRLANPSAIADIQQCFVRGYFGALIEGSATLARAAQRAPEAGQQRAGPLGVVMGRGPIDRAAAE